MILSKFISVIHNRRRHIWPAFLALAILVNTLGITIHLEPAALASQVAAKTPAISHVQTVNDKSQNPVATSTPVANSQPSGSIVVPSCNPAAYSLPSRIDLTNQANGLTQVSDPTSYYRIYGNNSDQIESQVRQCAPTTNGSDGAEFAAETSYSLNAQYNWAEDSSGYCRVTGAKVGLHINMILPQWQPNADSEAGLAVSWQTYINNLTTHENGHVAIDKQYAAQLLNDLQAFPAGDCASIADSLKTKVNADIAALDAANDAYDAATNHGATQGAIVP